MIERTVLYQMDLYDPDVIKRAAIAYRRICQIAIQDDGEATVCVFKAGEELDLIIHEFDNYMIEGMNRETNKW